MKRDDKIMGKLLKKHGKFYLENSYLEQNILKSFEDTKESTSIFSFTNYHRFCKHNFFHSNFILDSICNHCVTEKLDLNYFNIPHKISTICLVRIPCILRCLKSDQVRSFFWSVFSRIRTEYAVFLRIQSECGKIRTRKKLRIWTLFTHYCRQFLQISLLMLREFKQIN